MTTLLDVEPHIPALRRYAINLTRSRDNADDLVQETVLKILSRQVDAEEIENPRAYLITTLKRLFLDQIRAGRALNQSVDIDDVDLPSETATQDLTLATKEVLVAMRKLPHDLADILGRVGEAGHSYAEVARDLKVPMGTVMSRVSRARAALKRSLCNGQEDCPEARGAIANGL